MITAAATSPSTQFISKNRLCKLIGRNSRAIDHWIKLATFAPNGPAFRAEQTKCFLQQAGVHFLFSPSHWPEYNGAIEAAIGSLKRRTVQQAAHHGHAAAGPGRTRPPAFSKST